MLIGAQSSTWWLENRLVPCADVVPGGAKDVQFRGLVPAPRLSVVAQLSGQLSTAKSTPDTILQRSSSEPEHLLGRMQP